MFSFLLVVHGLFIAQAQYIVDTTFTHDDAQSYCSTHCQSDLGSIHSEEQFQSIQSLSNYEPQNGIWIGLKSAPHPTYVWNDGTTFDFAQWSANEPDSTGIECVAMASSFEWITATCDTSKRFLCNHCNGQINKYTLLYSDVTNIGYSYSDAQSACSSYSSSSTLASIHSTRDFNEAKTLCALSHNNCWIGLNDINSEGVYIYDDGTVFNYASDSIQFHHADRDCVHLSAANNYTFIDNACDATSSVDYALCHMPSALCSVNSIWTKFEGNMNGDCTKTLSEGTDIVMANQLWWNGPASLVIDYTFWFVSTDSTQIGSSGITLYNGLDASTCTYYYIFVQKRKSTNTFTLALSFRSGSTTDIVSAVPINTEYLWRNPHLLSIHLTPYDNTFSVYLDDILMIHYTDDDPLHLSKTRHDGFSGYIGIKTSSYTTTTSKSLYVSGTGYHVTHSVNILQSNVCPTTAPTSSPTTPIPTIVTTQPTKSPTVIPTNDPSKNPTKVPTNDPSKNPTLQPTVLPTISPTIKPSNPTFAPSSNPSTHPTDNPSDDPSVDPSLHPTIAPTNNPTYIPTNIPTNDPIKLPTNNPSYNPTNQPIKTPTNNPTRNPSNNPSNTPTNDPISNPSMSPTVSPINDPSISTNAPSMALTSDPTLEPTVNPTESPSSEIDPTTDKPTLEPTTTIKPTSNPSETPSETPTETPTSRPTQRSVRMLVTAQLHFMVSTDRITIVFLLDDFFMDQEIEDITSIVEGAVNGLIREDCGYSDGFRSIRIIEYPTKHQTIINGTMITCDVSRESVLISEIIDATLQETVIQNIRQQTQKQIILSAKPTIKYKYKTDTKTSTTMFVFRGSEETASGGSQSWISWILKFIVIQMGLCCLLLACFFGIKARTRQLTKTKSAVEQQISESKRFNPSPKLKATLSPQYSAMKAKASYIASNRTTFNEEAANINASSYRSNPFPIEPTAQQMLQRGIKFNNSGGISRMPMPNNQEFDDDEEEEEDGTVMLRDGDDKSYNHKIKAWMIKMRSNKKQGHHQMMSKNEVNTVSEIDMSDYEDKELFSMKSTYPLDMDPKTALVRRIDTDTTFPSIPLRDAFSSSNNQFMDNMSNADTTSTLSLGGETIKQPEPDSVASNSENDDEDDDDDDEEEEEETMSRIELPSKGMNADGSQIYNDGNDLSTSSSITQLHKTSFVTICEKCGTAHPGFGNDGDEPDSCAHFAKFNGTTY